MATAKPFTMEQLTPRHFQIMDLAVQGLPSGEIAKRINLGGAYVSTIMAAPNFQHQLAMRRAKFEERLDDKIVNTTIEAGNVLKQNAIRAANKMVSLLDSGTPGLQKSAAADIMDRVGLAKQTQQNVDVNAKVVVLDAKSASVIETLLAEESDLL